MKYLFLIIPVFVITSCQGVVQKVAEEINKSINDNDSLSKLNPDDEAEKEINYIAKGYKILQRKKDGNDSLFLVRNLYVWGKPYADTWYRNDKRDGLTILYHKDETVFFKIVFKDGKEQTVLQAFDTKGKALDHGNLKEGNGRLKYYDPVTDNLLSVTDYIHGVPEGEFLSYYQTGELFRKGFFKNGQLNGAFNFYFKNGKLKETGEIVNNKLVGEHYVYFRSGKVHYFQSYNNQGEILTRGEFDEKENPIIEGKRLKNGHYSETRYDYANNGELRSKGKYLDEMKNGTYEYFENKKLKALEYWKNDSLLRDQAWYSNGNLKSLTKYIKDKKDSVYTEYYSNGKLRLQQRYKGGLKDGIYVSYFENGNKFVEGEYKDDKPFGKFKHYHKDGTYNGSYTSIEK